MVWFIIHSRERGDETRKEWADDGLDNEDVKAISELLTINTSLKKLQLRCNDKSFFFSIVPLFHHEEWLGTRIKGDGEQALSRSLETNTTLTDLYLSSDNNVEKKKKRRKVMMQVDRKRHEFGRIGIILWIIDEEFNADSIETYLWWDPGLIQIIWIILVRNTASGVDKNAKPISELLKVNKSLIHLDLGGCDDEKERFKKE